MPSRDSMALEASTAILVMYPPYGTSFELPSTSCEGLEGLSSFFSVPWSLPDGGSEYSDKQKHSYRRR